MTELERELIESFLPQSEPQTAKPLFEQRVLATLDRATATFKGRGNQYGDTWGQCQFLTMKAVAERLGDQIDPKHLRALATAAFVDFKYARLLGGYKDDHLVDGLNYQAFLAEEMRELGVEE